MHKFLKKAGLVIILIFTTGYIGLKLINEPLPHGTEGDKADELAIKMLKSLNKEAYDSISQIKWVYAGGHRFNWNKKSNVVEVVWDDYRVNLNTKTLDGDTYKNNQPLNGKDKKKALEKAWSIFANDSFWLVAPFKLFDPGTIRKYVSTDEGEALLVTYTSGGVTPGDSYLWVLDENYLPKKWKLWVQIIPIGGIEFSWEGWVNKSGAWFSTEHRTPFTYTIEVKDLNVIK